MKRELLFLSLIVIVMLSVGFVGAQTNDNHHVEANEGRAEQTPSERADSILENGRATPVPNCSIPTLLTVSVKGSGTTLDPYIISGDFKKVTKEHPDGELTLTVHTIKVSCRSITLGWRDAAVFSSGSGKYEYRLAPSDLTGVKVLYTGCTYPEFDSDNQYAPSSAELLW